MEFKCIHFQKKKKKNNNNREFIKSRLALRKKS